MEETREVYYDWEAELPSGLWHLGLRKVQMRTHCRVHGFTNGERFIVQRVVKVLRHEPDPEGWQPPKSPRDGVQTA